MSFGSGVIDHIYSFFTQGSQWSCRQVEAGLLPPQQKGVKKVAICAGNILRFSAALPCVSLRVVKKPILFS
jgi:hypothetical protein